MAGQTLAIDNLVIAEEKVISSDVDLNYFDGDDLKKAEGNVLPAGVDAINVAVGTAFETGDVTDKVTVYADHTQIPVTNATLDGNGLTAKLSVPIVAGAACKIVLSKDTMLIDGSVAGTDVLYAFKTAYENSAIAGASFKVNSNTLYSVAQLSAGDVIEAVVTHPSVSEETYRAYFLGVYEGTKIVAIKCVSADISLSAETEIELTLPADFTLSDKTQVKLFSVSSLSGRVPASEVYSIK